LQQGQIAESEASLRLLVREYLACSDYCPSYAEILVLLSGLLRDRAGGVTGKERLSLLNECYKLLNEADRTFRDNLIHLGWVGHLVDEKSVLANKYLPHVLQLAKVRALEATVIEECIGEQLFQETENRESPQQESLSGEAAPLTHSCALELVQMSLATLKHYPYSQPSVEAELLLLEGVLSIRLKERGEGAGVLTQMNEGGNDTGNSGDVQLRVSIPESSCTQISSEELATKSMPLDEAGIIRSLERSLNLLVSIGGSHNRSQIHMASMALVIVLGNSSTISMEVRNVRAAQFLRMCAATQIASRTLMNGVPTLSLTPATRLEIVPSSVKMDLIATDAASEVNSDATGKLREASPSKSRIGANSVDPTASCSSLNLLCYYLSILRERHVGKGTRFVTELDKNIATLHAYLQSNLASYRDECCISLPAPAEEGATAISMPENIVCVQWCSLFSMNPSTCSMVCLLGSTGNTAGEDSTTAGGQMQLKILDKNAVNSIHHRAAQIRQSLEAHNERGLENASLVESLQSQFDTLLDEANLLIRDGIRDSMVKSIPCEVENVRAIEDLFNLEVGIDTHNEAVCKWARSTLLGENTDGVE